MSYYLTGDRIGGRGTAETWFDPATGDRIMFAFVRSAANGHRETLCYRIAVTFEDQHNIGDSLCAYGEIPAHAVLIAMSPIAFLTHATLEEIAHHAPSSL